MHVALVTSAFPQPRRGRTPGIETLAISLVNQLTGTGLEVSIITTIWNGGGHTDRYQGSVIRRVPDLSKYWGRYAAVGDLHYWSWGYGVRKALESTKRPDVVHSLSPLASTREIVRSGIPLITSFHHHQETARPRDLLYEPFHRVLESRAYCWSTLVATPSRASADFVVRAFGVPDKRIRITPWGVDVARFHPKDTSTGAGNRLLFVGPHESRKGLRYLLEAIALLRADGVDVRLTTAGTGPKLPMLKSLAAKLGIPDSLRFMGYVDDPDGTKIPRLYAESDIFVLPSSREGFGLVLVEAMAAGLAVVGSNLSAIPEVLGDAGLLVPPRDAAALADAIRMLVESPEKRRDLGRKARKRVESVLSWPKVIPAIVSVYDEAIALTRKR